MWDHLVYQGSFTMVDVGNDGYVSYFRILLIWVQR